MTIIAEHFNLNIYFLWSSHIRVTSVLSLWAHIFLKQDQETWLVLHPADTSSGNQMYTDRPTDRLTDKCSTRPSPPGVVIIPHSPYFNHSKCTTGAFVNHDQLVFLSSSYLFTADNKMCLHIASSF